MSNDLAPIPFGTQYYRAPVPLPEDWAEDFRVMKDTGLDCVKLWVQWRWNHPAIDRTWFDDIDGLCEMAGRHEMQVVLNSILDIAPAWLFEAFPDAYMVTAGGRVAYSQATACRQIGGSPGPCYHHAGAWEKAWEFLAAAAQRYADHPAVWGWDIWNEPELSMVHRYSCESDLANMVCYCGHSRRAFADWLLARYGSLDAVNAAHSRNYQRPEEIEAPRSTEIYRDMLDWRLFFCDTLADNMRRRAEIIRRHAPRQRVVTHTVPPIALTITNAANDEWKLAEPVDEFGASFPLYAPLTYEMDMNRSAAKGKRIWSAEFYPGTTTNLELSPAFNEKLNRLILLPLFHGYKGYLMWQWRGEKLGREGGWGVHHGLPQPAWPAVRQLKGLVDILRRHGPWLRDAQPATPGTAILFNPEAELMAYSVFGRSQPYQESMVGLHQALATMNLPLHFVHPMEVSAGKLKDYQVLVMPYPVWVAQDLGEAIRQWVRDGGVLISECHFAGRDPSNGFTWETIPGLGFDEVFGARQAGFRIARRLEQTLDVHVTTRADLPHLPAGTTLTGARAGESLQPSTAEVLAVHENAQPAITRNRYGAGQAVLLGSFFGAAYRRAPEEALEKLLLSLLPADLAGARPVVQAPAQATVRTLRGDGREWVYVENLADAEQEVALTLPESAPAGTFRNIQTGQTIELTADGTRRRARITLPAHTVGVFASQ